MVKFLTSYEGKNLHPNLPGNSGLGGFFMASSSSPQKIQRPLPFPTEVVWLYPIHLDEKPICSLFR